MAENWHEVRESLAGQDEYFEWRCRICEENDLIKKATSYCKNCDECLCSSCLKSHSRYNKSHKVLGEKEKVEWGKTESGQDTGIECTEHPGQTVSMYCGQHDDLCCPVCAVLKHTDTCKPNMTYIPQVAKGIMNGDEFKAVINSNDSLIASLTRLIEERTKLQVKLSASREECARRIEEFHRELTQHLEKLKEDSLSEMNNKHNAEEQNIEEDIERCTDVKKELCEMKRQMNPTDSVNESLVFVKMKKFKTSLANYEEIPHNLDAAERLTFEFNPNSSLHDTVTSALKLGDCAGVNQQTTLHYVSDNPYLAIRSKYVEVVVEYDYDAEEPDELSIKPGDIIKNVIIVEGGWWEGELNGKKGMFPDNFVKVVKNQPEVEKRDDTKKKQVQASKRQSVKDLANKLKDSVHEGPPMMRRKESRTKKKRAIVVFSHDPENEDELKLGVGDFIDVLKQEEEGWWEGILNGKQGMFPSNYVEILDDTESAEPEKTGSDASQPDRQSGSQLLAQLLSTAPRKGFIETDFDQRQEAGPTGREDRRVARNSRERRDWGRDEDRSNLTRVDYISAQRGYSRREDRDRQDWDRNEDRSNLTREDSAQRRDSRRGDRYPDSHQLFVDNFPHGVQERELKDFFQAFGNVVELRINTNIGSGKIPNFGFVVFDSPEAVQTVVKNKPIKFKEHRLIIEEKKSRGVEGRPIRERE